MFFEGAYTVSRHRRDLFEGEMDLESSGGWITLKKFQEVLDMDVTCDPIDS
jgi:hypothetical protein